MSGAVYDLLCVGTICVTGGWLLGHFHILCRCRDSGTGRQWDEDRL